MYHSKSAFKSNYLQTPNSWREETELFHQIQIKLSPVKDDYDK